MARFIIADDSMVMRTILQFMLEKKGHAVLGAARDGREAVDLFRKHRPEAVALDVMMRGVDGLEALVAIKKIAPEVVVFMIGDEKQQREVQEGLAAGAQGVFCKPFLLNQVSDELVRCL